MRRQGGGGGTVLAIGSRPSLKTLAVVDAVDKAAAAWLALSCAMTDSSRIWQACRSRRVCARDAKPAGPPPDHDEPAWPGFLDAAGKQRSRAAAGLTSARAGRLGHELCSALAGSPACTDKAHAAARSLAPSGRRGRDMLCVRRSPCQVEGVGTTPAREPAPGTRPRAPHHILPPIATLAPAAKPPAALVAGLCTPPLFPMRLPCAEPVRVQASFVPPPVAADAGATKARAHRRLVGRLVGPLFRTAGHRVRTQHGVSTSAENRQKRGDVEILDYLQDAAGSRNLGCEHG